MRAVGRWVWAVALLTAPALSPAQDRRELAYDAAAAHTRIVQNTRISVGDASDHILRIYDLRRKFTLRPPVFEGVRATQMWEQGVADTIDQSGTETAYVTFVLEDGNRVLGRYAGIVHSFRWPDGSRHYDHVGTITLTGGSGAFARLRGTVRVRAAVDPGADSNQIESKGAYWMEQ